MPECQNCGYIWTWKETFIKMFTFRQKLNCPSCEKFQYLTKRSRNKVSLFVMSPFLIWIPLVSINMPIQTILTAGLITYVLVLMSMPYLYKLSNKEEHMW
ncbi:TIGR04104 family putative zinc finger protein [Rossellomorea oryzaecorticis]|uniref:TIGR04104 family putative zinc finger protein n=1 Tax=Rossellomorea oryzaecorticis TaxID=1396505 RepID=UPI003CCB42D9